MSKRQWLVLLMLFLTYLLLGAAMFYHIESELEVEKVKKAREHREEINALLHKHYLPNTEHDQHIILQKLTDYCGKSVYNYTKNEVDSYKWDFYNSFYFAYTVVSTIGYGNLAPTNMMGRILMIFYGLIGIPMNGILLAALGDFFGHVFVRAHKKYKSYKESHSETPKRLKPLETRRAGLAAQIFMYLAPGFVMFIFFPAFLFSYYEGWEYDEAVYYAFVTLTTIGFGDYVAGQDNTKGSGIFFIMYKVFLIIWISFGLGYLVMIMSFIARGMRSKRITRLEHKLAMNLKQTQSKIWNEFNKDVNYLRRVFNEVYLMKIKPVYRDEFDHNFTDNDCGRSCSFPDLRELIYGGLEPEAPACPRRRANSEVAQIIQFEAINRTVSDTDLSRIDKTATFATHAIVQPAEFLSRLINALGYIPPSADDFEPSTEEEDQSSLKGVDGFSEKEILASEKPWAGSGWRIGGDKLPAPRTRAASEIGLGKDYNGVMNNHNAEWTWSGPAASRKIQELMKARKSSNASKEAKSRMPSFSFASVPKNIRPRWFNRFSSKKNSVDISRRDSLPDDDLMRTHLGENYLSHTANTKPIKHPELNRRQSATPHYFTHTGGNLPNSPDVNLLEQTSLADFLRALTSLHSKVGAVPEDFVNKPVQRKMGTASLTPPKLPSLLALFSPPPGFTNSNQSTQSTITTGQNGARRRFSLRPVENSGASTPNHQRRGSLMANFGPRRFSVRPDESSENSLPIYQQRRGSLMAGSGPRRFSLRPEENSGSSTPTYQRRGSLIPGSRPRRYSLKAGFTPGKVSPLNTPPYTPDLVSLHAQEHQHPPPYSADPFVFESPKEPLVNAEVVPARDGLSLPVRAAPAVPRRFSLRPAQIGVPPAPASPKVPPTGRPLPKWKGGMLQRQISEMSLQRRARAFSLGDVHAMKNERFSNPPSPLAFPHATSNLSTIFARQSENSEDENSQVPNITVSLAPTGDFGESVINNAKQTSASIDQSLSDQMEARGSHKSARFDVRHVVFKAEEDTLDEVAVDLKVFGENRDRTGEVKWSNPFTSDIQEAGKSAESKTTTTREEAFPKIRINDRRISVKSPLATDYSESSELQSIMIDEPSSKSTVSSDSVTEGYLLTEVKVDSLTSLKSNETETKGSGSGTSSGRKTSVISQKSTGSVSSDTGVEKSLEKKLSTISQQSIELESISGGSRKSSTSKSRLDKPRVSIDSYKPLIELKIEKPATNPFEQYKASVVSKMDKPRDGKSSSTRKTSTEVEDETVETQFSTKASVKHEEPEVWMRELTEEREK